MRYLPVLLPIGLLVYCIVDVLQADGARVRALPKAFWILLIVLVPFVGPIAWLLAGRPVSGAGAARSSFGGRRTRPASPDDDPDFLAGLARSNAQRERERRLREKHDEPHDEPPADPSA